MVNKCSFLFFFVFMYVMFADEIECSNVVEIELYSDELPVIILDYNHLINYTDLSSSIALAFGDDGLGILFVKNIPNYATKRRQLLRQSRVLSYLPDNIKSTLEDPSSLYAVGYSHGKEKLSKNKPDYYKMSYYGNPIINNPTDNSTLIDKYPEFYAANIWPKHDNNKLQESFMDLGQLIHNVGQLIAWQNDNYVSKIWSGYNSGTLFDAVNSNVPKGRLLYYFSEYEMNKFGYKNSDNNSNDSNDDSNDNWCGWHCDHSSLTGLCLGMYFDMNGNELYKIYDDTVGLYIKTRNNKLYNINLNEDDASQYLAFQIGETSQVLSKGILKATPHMVKGCGKNNQHISRSTFAVFHQPNHTFSMHIGNDNMDLERMFKNSYLPDNVIPLNKRWNNNENDTFGKFSRRTWDAYY